MEELAEAEAYMLGQILDSIFSVNIDSTASNTGKRAGSATLLQDEIDSAYIWVVYYVGIMFQKRLLDMHLM